MQGAVHDIQPVIVHENKIPAKQNSKLYMSVLLDFESISQGAGTMTDPSNLC